MFRKCGVEEFKGGTRKEGGGAVGMVHTMEGKGKETQKRRYGCAEEKVLT